MDCKELKIEANIRVVPEIGSDPEKLLQFCSQRENISKKRIHHVEVKHRSIDARQKKIFLQLKVDLYVDEDFIEPKLTPIEYPNVAKEEPVLIIGSGPAGLFAALRLISLGKKPVILERGKNVKDRVADLRGINVHHIVNEDSNYCFGEGGAGTYSDGKLYTRSKKRGNVIEVLETLVRFGATKQILVDAHPHIGTNKLPRIIQNMREYIINQGGEIHFQTRVVDFLLKENSLMGVLTKNGDRFTAKKVILATGHSGREIFHLLAEKNYEIHPKPFALGIRIEHPQSLIDQIQYHCEVRGPYLPPSEYSIVKQIEGRGVYSFCMCPGGVIAPCATKPGEVVTNGWSSAERSRPTANSGIVVELRMEDFTKYKSMGVLSALSYQSDIERRAFLLNGGTQKAPAQRLVDFLQSRLSTNLPKTSYAPGLSSIAMDELFPELITSSLRKAFVSFNESMPGYISEEAILHAPETRTSSPVLIPRDPDSLEHVQLKGLFPCGEGAGYAGGIVSAAMDGIKCADAAAKHSSLK